MFTLSPHDAIEKFKKTKTTAVYCLIKNEKVIYVGASDNVSTRIYSHVTSSKDFDTVEIHVCSSKERTELEASLIIKHRPQHNTTLPYSKKFITMRECVSINNTTINKLVKELPVVFMNNRIWYVEKSHYEGFIQELEKAGSEYISKLNEEFLEANYTGEE